MQDEEEETSYGMQLAFRELKIPPKNVTRFVIQMGREEVGVCVCVCLGMDKKRGVSGKGTG